MQAEAGIRRRRQEGMAHMNGKRIYVYVVATMMTASLQVELTWSQPLFNNIIDSTGIQAVTTRGIALGDYNADGRLDIYLCSNPGPSYLYRNDGQNHFTDVTAASGIEVTEMTAAPTWVDFDNDGDLDLFVAAYMGANRLYRQDNNYFHDVAAAAGVQEVGCITNQGTWADFNRDGKADLLLANTDSYRPVVLYQNSGDGTFADVTTVTGINGPPNARAAIWGDFNNDRWPDFYVHGINSSLLYINNADGTFHAANLSPTLDGFSDGLACAWRDLDNNGFLDLTLGAWYQPLCILLNLEGTFIRASGMMAGTIPQSTGGATYADIDNDGYADLHTKEVYGRELLFKNSKGSGFIDISFEAGFGDGSGGGNAACGDLDNDGDLDLIAARFEPHPLYYYRNALDRIDPSNHWLDINLIGIKSNRSAIGAKVELFAGSEMQMQERSCGESGLTQSTSLLHFGLKDKSLVDSLVVYWPCGAVQKIDNVLADQRLEIIEDPLSAIPAGRRAGRVDVPFISLQNFPNPFNASTTLEFYLPREGYVSLRVLSMQGRQMALLVDRQMAAGIHRLSWDASALPSGIYTCLLQRSGERVMKKVVLLR